MAARLATTFAFAAFFATVAPAALAQSSDDADPAVATARAQYAAGTRAFEAQRYAEAAAAFEAAADAKPSPVALYTAALSWDRSNALDRAADDYARAIALGGLPADKATQARERLATLELSLGQVSITGPDGARAEIEGNPERPLPAVLHAAAGTRTLVVKLAGGTVDRRTVVVEARKTARVDVAAPPPPPAAGPPPPAAPPAAPEPAPALPPPTAPPQASPPTPWTRSVGLPVAGAGIATLLAGVVLGIEALDARDAYKAAPAQATYDHASQLQTWTNVAFVAGGVLTAAGVTLALLPSPSSAPQSDQAPGAPSPAPAARLVVSPSSAWITGSF